VEDGYKFIKIYNTIWIQLFIPNEKSKLLGMIIFHSAKVYQRGGASGKEGVHTLICSPLTSFLSLPDHLPRVFTTLPDMAESRGLACHFG
jgi:hypothetical protein